MLDHQPKSSKRIHVKVIGFALLVVGLVACHDEPPLRPVSAWAQRVRVENGDPPAGARLLGEIKATDGQGCGIGGDRGSLGNATGALKEAAARRGANFIKLTQVTKPYAGHDCYHQEFTLYGLAYAVGDVPPLEAASTACAPPCSPGYACSSSGVCLAQCNPACAPQEICRADRVCVPSPSALHP
jgi:hypothetical protein